jgi:hypothetical protein
MPRTYAEIKFSRKKYLLSGVLTPLLCVVPLLLAGAISVSGRLNPAYRNGLFLACVALSLVGSAILLRRSKMLRFGMGRADQDSALG